LPIIADGFDYLRAVVVKQCLAIADCLHAQISHISFKNREGCLRYPE
jgi:hypothetical protein